MGSSTSCDGEKSKQSLTPVVERPLPGPTLTLSTDLTKALEFIKQPQEFDVFDLKKKGQVQKKLVFFLLSPSSQVQPLHGAIHWSDLPEADLLPFQHLSSSSSLSSLVSTNSLPIRFVTHLYLGKQTKAFQAAKKVKADECFSLRGKDETGETITLNLKAKDKESAALWVKGLHYLLLGRGDALKFVRPTPVKTFLEKFTGRVDPDPASLHITRHWEKTLPSSALSALSPADYVSILLQGQSFKNYQEAKETKYASPTKDKFTFGGDSLEVTFEKIKFWFQPSSRNHGYFLWKKLEDSEDSDLDDMKNPAHNLDVGPSPTRRKQEPGRQESGEGPIRSQSAQHDIESTTDHEFADFSDDDYVSESSRSSKSSESESESSDSEIESEDETRKRNLLRGGRRQKEDSSSDDEDEEEDDEEDDEEEGEEEKGQKGKKKTEKSKELNRTERDLQVATPEFRRVTTTPPHGIPRIPSNPPQGGLDPASNPPQIPGLMRTPSSQDPPELVRMPSSPPLLPRLASKTTEWDGKFGLRYLKRVYLGKQTQVFKSSGASSCREDRCVSLIFEKDPNLSARNKGRIRQMSRVAVVPKLKSKITRSFNLEAESPEKLREWMTGLDFLLRIAQMIVFPNSETADTEIQRFIDRNKVISTPPVSPGTNPPDPTDVLRLSRGAPYRRPEELAPYGPSALMLKMLTDPNFLSNKKEVIEAVFGLLRGGEQFKLLTKNSAGQIVPYEIHLRVDIEARTIHWRSVPRMSSVSNLNSLIDLKKSEIVGTFLLEDVANVTLGLRFPEFKSVLPPDTPSSHFFSLMGTRPEFTLDLVCSRKDQAVDWLFGLNTLLLTRKTVAVRPPSEVPPLVLQSLDSTNPYERIDALRQALEKLGIPKEESDILYQKEVDLKKGLWLNEAGWDELKIQDPQRRQAITRQLDYLSSLQSVPEPHIKRTPGGKPPPPLYIATQHELDEEEVTSR